MQRGALQAGRSHPRADSNLSWAPITLLDALTGGKEGEQPLPETNSGSSSETEAFGTFDDVWTCQTSGLTLISSWLTCNYIIPLNLTRASEMKFKVNITEDHHINVSARERRLGRDEILENRSRLKTSLPTNSAWSLLDES